LNDDAAGDGSKDAINQPHFDFYADFRKIL
jgi:hypothetical protein